MVNKKREKRELELLELRRQTMLRKAEKAKEAKRKREQEVSNRRHKKYNDKRYEASRSYHKKIHDKYGYFIVAITKDNKKQKVLNVTRWRSTSYDKYTKFIEENQKIIFPRLYKVKKRPKTFVPIKDEIIIYEMVDPLFESTESYVQNDIGKFVQVNVNDRNAKIISKHSWKVEAEFIVAGEKPTYRKASYILYEMLLKNDYKSFTTKRVYRYKNKIIFKTDYDIEVIECVNVREAIEFSAALFRHIPSENKFIFYFSEPISEDSPLLLEVREHTKWSKQHLNSDILCFEQGKKIHVS